MPAMWRAASRKQASIAIADQRFFTLDVIAKTKRRAPVMGGDVMDVAAILPIATFLVPTGIALIAVRQTANALRETRRANAADLEPFVSVVPENASEIRVFGKSLEPPSVQFRIKNSGRGPAFVTKMYRTWKICPPLGQPPFIDYSQTKQDEKQKEFWIPVGPQSLSEVFLAQSEEHVPAALAAAKGGEWLYFLGWLEFKDINGNEYAAGFTHVYRPDREKMGLHFALPDSDGNEYNYHRRLGPTNRRRWFPWGNPK